MEKKLSHSILFKRVLSLALTLVMLLSWIPVGNAHAAEGDTTVYLKPSSNWQSDNARFAVYYFDGESNAWADMTDEDGDGYYEGTVPAGYANIIFCRMSPATTENIWSNKWNQTSDLTLPTDGTNCYTVAEGAWDNGAGSWSAYTPSTTVYLKPNSNWQSNNARFAVYYFEDESNGWADMTDEDGDGYYEGTVPGGYSNIIFCRMNPSAAENNWDNRWNQTSNLTLPSDGTNCYTVAEGAWDNGAGSWSIYPPEPTVTYIVAGSAGLCDPEWTADDTANAMSKNADGLYEKVYEGVAAGTYEFKVTDGSWSNSWGKDGGNYSFTIEEESTVTITFDADTKAITVSTEAAGGQDPEPSGTVYIVAGDSALCGTNWDITDSSNTMSLSSDGLYEKTYSNVPVGTYNFKITAGSWDASWGNNGSNFTFEVKDAACDVTISFNETTKEISVSGANVQIPSELIIDAMYAVGNGSGNWLNGTSWAPAAEANKMTETSDNVYEITFEDIAEGDAYEVKFAANGEWTHSWGGTYSESGAEADAVYNGSNITVNVPYENADVTLKLDLTSFDYSTKSGAKFTITVAEADAGAAPASPDYYLIGNINGADYGCEADWENLGDYKFVDGKLTATFTQDSYVFVKTGDNNSWYMAEQYSTDTSVTLKNTSTGTSEKLFVPGNTELTFTLVENADGTLTLSYETVSSDIPEGYTAVTIHFLKPENWGSGMNAYVWTSAGALTGYEAYNTWPGKAVSENATHAGWYDLLVATEQPTAFNFIFNDGGNQTGDLYTGEITGDTELWVVGGTVMTTAPGEWTGDYDYTAHIHFQKPESWGETINAWIWDTNGAIPGYEQYQDTWPGSPIAADVTNSGWYNVSVTVDENTGFSFILNDGTNKTADLSTGTLQVTTDIWVVDGEVQTTAPDGWVDPNRTAHVPGTFPGESWSASSNQMSYDADLGLYIYTFEDVPAAKYEYKIAINGSWNENYGVGGVKDGANIAVTVPQVMDVIVYYNDATHNSVTNVDYIFADIALSGTGIPENTKLEDKGLSGIYSVTVNMAAGTYSDVTITYNGKDYTFTEFTLEEGKDVTFYMDPVTEIFYHNGSNVPVDTGSIYYNSQNSEYKSPFGAPATSEEITFSLDSDDAITSAVLVIKGVDSYPMTAAETTEGKRWSCTVSIENAGEYDYYFTVSNGSSVAIYGDDDGYYGEGKVTDLTNVMPYDLVVYQAGYETPDWMKDAVIYQIFPDRFFDGDPTNNLVQTWARGDVDYEYISDWYTLPENPEQETMLDKETYLSSGAHYGDGEWSNEIYGGDLEGITQRIDYLKALGVNVIYLNPVFWSISNHRYDAVDYMTIDPILGTLGDFEELVAIAEANDMHIILDGVFNHVSDDSIYFDRYYKFLGKSEKIGAYPYWAYVYDYMAENSADQASAEAAAKAYFTEEYGITDYSYTEWFEVRNTTMAGTVDSIGLREGKEVYSYEGWWGYDSMPVIKSTNGSEYQTGDWAEEIIYNETGTSVTQYWITKGNNGWRLDVANEVSDETWQKFRNSVKALDSDAVIIGEIWDDATKYLMGDMYDSVMNYQFRNAVTGFAMGTNAENTTKALEKIRERYPEEAFYAMMNLVGSHDTTRILSYLDGIGDDRNQKDFDSAFPTYEGTSDLAKNRQYLVAFLQFTYPGAPTIYYGDEIGMVGADDPDDRRAFEWGMGNQELVEWYAKMAAIREAYPALRTGDITPIDLGNTNLLAYTRNDDTNSLIVIANNSQFSQTVELDGSYVDLVSGETFTSSVPALRGVVLVTEDDAKVISIDADALAPAYDASYIVGERNVSHTHSHTAVVTDPTCTEKGYTTYTCECGDTYVGDYVDATSHSYTSVTTDPTCTEKGYTTYTCECGDSYVGDHKDALGHNFKDGSCTHCGDEDPDYEAPTEPSEPESVPAAPVKPSKPQLFDKVDDLLKEWLDQEIDTDVVPDLSEISRVFGENRYETVIKVADALKEYLCVDKFDTVIVASGTGFADALSGSYLANVKTAPILLVNNYSESTVKAYINANVVEGGTVYLLGGEDVLPASMEEGLDSFKVVRLAGSNRYETNLAILEEAGVEGQEILVCTGRNFADSLSASAVGKPILLVNQKLSDAQKKFLADTTGKFIIIGGENAVSAKLEAELKAYGTVERLNGANRYETSVLVAQRFFEAPVSAVLAYAKNFPDGLCGGPLAYSLNAPLILTATGMEATAELYASENNITDGIVLGGEGLISDETTNQILGK